MGTESMIEEPTCHIYGALTDAPFSLLPMVGKPARVLIDEADLDAVRPRRWRLHRAGSRDYVVSRLGTGLARPLVYLARFLMNPPPDMVVDHISGDTLDNRRSNLRICTRAENNRNRRPCGGRSRFNGVYQLAGRWRASIQHDDQRYSLGMYDREEDAARAYDEAARRLFGAFARLNLPSAP